MLGGRKIVLYWFAVSGGKIHAGWDDLPDWVLALQPGFHIAASWALLAGPSGAIYGTVGSNLRNYHSGILNAQLKAVGKDKPPQELAVHNLSPPPFDLDGRALGRGPLQAEQWCFAIFKSLQHSSEALST